MSSSEEDEKSWEEDEKSWSSSSSGYGGGGFGGGKGYAGYGGGGKGGGKGKAILARAMAPRPSIIGASTATAPKFIVIGNPGTGKSTTINCYLQELLFKSGPSRDGCGLTYQLDQRTSKDGRVFLDTPGLSDLRLRKAAARAIDEALQAGGDFQIVFFFMQTEGRWCNDDLTTMKLVIDATRGQLPEDSYALIVNKCDEDLLQEFQDQPQVTEDMIHTLRTACQDRNVPFTKNICFAPEIRAMKRKDNVVMPLNPALQQFLDDVPLLHINKDEVDNVKHEQWEQIAEQCETAMELAKQAAAHAWEAERKVQEESRQAAARALEAERKAQEERQQRMNAEKEAQGAAARAEEASARAAKVERQARQPMMRHFCCCLESRAQQEQDVHERVDHLCSLVWKFWQLDFVHKLLDSNPEVMNSLISFRSKKDTGSFERLVWQLPPTNVDLYKNISMVMGAHEDLPKLYMYLAQRPSCPGEQAVRPTPREEELLSLISDARGFEAHLRFCLQMAPPMVSHISPKGIDDSLTSGALVPGKGGTTLTNALTEDGKRVLSDREQVFRVLAPGAIIAYQGMPDFAQQVVAGNVMEALTGAAGRAVGATVGEPMGTELAIALQTIILDSNVFCNIIKYGRVGLVAGVLGFDICKNIYLWFRGDVSGKRAVKSVVDGVAGTLGGLGGAAVGGAALGGLTGGPIGAFVGGFVGGVVGGLCATSLSDKLSTQFFDLPQSVAVENAYNFLGVHHTAPNEELNRAYRGLALKLHPDKPGGSAHKFQELQVALEIVRVSREGVGT